MAYCKGCVFYREPMSEWVDNWCSNMESPEHARYMKEDDTCEEHTPQNEKAPRNLIKVNKLIRRELHDKS